MSKGIIYKTDGSEEPFEELEQLSLPALQETVGGYIEMIRLSTPYGAEGWDMAWINEEGKVGTKDNPEGLPYNRKASLILSEYASQYIGVSDTRGDVVLTKMEYQEEFDALIKAENAEETAEDDLEEDTETGTGEENEGEEEVEASEEPSEPSEESSEEDEDDLDLDSDLDDDLVLEDEDEDELDEEDEELDFELEDDDE